MSERLWRDEIPGEGCFKERLWRDDFTVNYPAGTKATKQGWENGDAVFVFFQGYPGFYVKLTYDGSK